MLIPSRALLACAALLAGVGVAAVWQPDWTPWWQASLTLLSLAAVVDAVLASRAAPPRVERLLTSSLPLGVAQRAVLRIHNPGSRAWPVEAHDMAPLRVHIEHLPQRTRLPPCGFVELHYSVTGVERGAAEFGPAALRLASPLRLWQRQTLLGPGQAVRIYPDFAAVSEYVLLLSQARVQQMGIQKRRRRGEGSEFHQLREYREGDPLRQVDWRATARRRHLISREYQEERDQNLILLLDCGQRMRAQDGALSHFDHALNALLLLAHVALRQGDAVGLAAFGADFTWARPVRGVRLLNSLLNRVLELQPGPLAPDYSRAALALLARQRKRSLVLVVSSLRGEDVSDLLPALALLRRRHRVVLAALREQALDAACAQPVTDFEGALRCAGAHGYLAERRRALAEVRATGVSVLDALPQDLPVALVNQYFALKAT
jgi:uncharacterized protein (DUF58 family)